jgi:hypothetical protein
MTGLSQLADGPVEACPGIRLARAEHAGDLRVRESAGELQEDQVALLAVERRQRRPNYLAADSRLGVVVDARRFLILGIDLEAGSALAAAQLVERGMRAIAKSQASGVPRGAR